MKRLFYPTTAALVAVVFLLALSGCSTTDADAPLFSGAASVSETKTDAAGKPRKKRRKASDYSRIPVNTPADWQRATMGL